MKKDKSSPNKFRSPDKKKKAIHRQESQRSNRSRSENLNRLMTFAQDDSLFDVLNEFKVEAAVQEEKIIIKQRTDRKILDYKQVVKQKKEKIVEKSIDLSMGEDEKGQPFKVITSEQYVQNSNTMKTKGLIDISMDFF